MITIYQLFKIVFGLIASGFILYFLIHYTGIYITVQEDVQRVLIIQNFRKAVQDVYFTGNPTSFTDFGMLDFSLYFDGQAEPSVMRSEVGEMVFLTPLFFSPSDEIFVDRNQLDHGWFKFYFVEALPEIFVIFNPLDTGLQQDMDWELMKNITVLFPSTTSRTPKVKFGLCGYPDGDSLPVFWERYDFLDSPSAVLKQAHAAMVFSKCNVSMSWNQRLVTISQSCSPGFITQGICIQPPTKGIGFAYINGSDSSYMYKDPLDLAALIIGGDNRDIYGISTLGESLYEYKNKIWRERVRLASMIMGQRAQLIETKLPPIEELSDCRTLYSSFRGILYFNPDSIYNILSQEDYYTSHNTVFSLLDKLGEAKSVYQNMVNKGCEYAL